MKEKIVLIGAGSAMFTRGLVRDLIERGWEAELSLVDIAPDALCAAEKLVRKMVHARKASLRISADVDRRRVLPGATTVICTIGVGGRRAWEQDVFVPRNYGIYQPVGDTVMPGGTSRALRMIPAMVDIARDVLDLSPDTLFFNYGNPMGPVCRAVRKATGANLVGLCHGVNQVGNYLAGMLGVEPADFRYTAVGMNHLTWFTEMRAAGADAKGRLRKVAERQLARLDETRYLGVLFKKDGTLENDEVLAKEINPFSWQLFQLFDAFPAALDRHVTEFFPQMFRDGEYFGKKLGVDAYSFEGCIAFGDREFEEMRRIALSDGPLPEGFFDGYIGEHEQVVDIIESIRGDFCRVYSANLPNAGQVPNLPEEAVIESPAVAGGEGLRAISQPPLPSGIVGTLATRLQWVETVVEAALDGSHEKFVQALLIDGAVESVETAYRLADDLLRAQIDHVPQFRV